MRMYRKNKRKIFAFFLVISMVLTVLKPQIVGMVFAEEQFDAEIYDGEEVSTPCDAVNDFEDVTEDVTEVTIEAVGENDSDEEIAEESTTEEIVTEENVADEAKVISTYVLESGCSITINAPAGSLPYPDDELSVSVREIKQGSVEYSAYIMAAANALNQDSKEDIAFARFFDIEILRNGEKIEPLLPVEVKIEYDDALDISKNEELSIVHFADEGTEVISDIELNKDATEIVYEQGSFSVTATIITATSVPVATAAGKSYALVAECEGKVYIVQGDGTLTEVESFEKTGDVITSVKTNNPMLWNYIEEGGNTYLRYAAEGYDFNWTNQATNFAQGYIDPTNDAGVSKEQVDRVEQRVNPAWDESPTITYFDNTKDHCNIILNAQRQIYHNGSSNSYIAVDSENERLAGNLNLTADSEMITKTKFYFANIDNGIADVTDGSLAWNHMVNHIDISVSDEVSVDLPLAYGTYYNAAGKVVLTIDKDSPSSMKKTTVTKEINVRQEYLRTAEIETFCNGAPIDDAFCITGYSSNAPSGYSGNQVRIEGRFKVANLAPITTGYTPNPDDVMAERLKPENQIRYKITAIQPDEEFTYTHPTTGETLYDSEGNPITIKGDVTISAEFGYWDYNPSGKGSNECPPIQENWSATDFSKWRQGAILSTGTSGMDFRLTGESTVNRRLCVVEIENKIIDEDGNPIIPRDTITGFNYGIYVDEAGDSDTVIGKNAGSYTGDKFDLSTYSKKAEKTMSISNDESKNATNVVYEYSLPEGMVYIDEDKTTVPEIIIDKDGNRWVYKKTYIETEYVWRTGDSNNGGKHFSKDYNESDSAFNSVPEILGTYGTEFNDFLEFYVRNVYEKIEPPTKKEILPYKGSGTLGGVDVGNEITYEISYKNYKNRAADVVIKDKLDKNVEFVSASDSGVYDKSTHTVIWTLKDVASEKDGKVTLKVKVLKGALEENGGPGYVVNGGDTSTVQVGNDDAYTLEVVKNPVPKTPTTTTTTDTPTTTTTTTTTTDTPTTTVTTTTTTTSVKTGDGSPLYMMFMLMGVSAVMIGTLYMLRRKKK